MSIEVQVAIYAVVLAIGVFITPVAKKIIMNGRSTVKNKDVDRLESGMEKGFTFVVGRLDTFEKNHREDVKALHEKIEGLGTKYVSRDEFRMCRDQHIGDKKGD